MASFFNDLWESIFTPGPTSSILIATNVSFGALQFVLLWLLLATYSVHFVVLSVLCGGLWWAINWFAAEVKIAQELERQEKATNDKAAAVEAENRAEARAQARRDASDTEVEGGNGQEVAVKKSQAEVVEGGVGEVKRRGLSEGRGMASSVSTEDEWEKVSEGDKEK